MDYQDEIESAQEQVRELEARLASVRKELNRARIRLMVAELGKTISELPPIVVDFELQEGSPWGCGKSFEWHHSRICSSYDGRISNSTFGGVPNFLLNKWDYEKKLIEASRKPQYQSRRSRYLLKRLKIKYKSKREKYS